MTLAGFWCLLQRVHAEAGQGDAVRAAAAHGVAWLQRAAADQVAEPLRDADLPCNPVRCGVSTAAPIPARQPGPVLDRAAG